MTMIDTMERPVLPAAEPRDEQCLGISIRITRTAEVDERLRYRVTVTGLPGDVQGLAAGDVIGYGPTPARARRRATDKIANRRRGPVREHYEVQGVTVRVIRNVDPSAPHAHGHVASVAAVAHTSPVRALVGVGQVLARKPTAAAAADRAHLVIGQLVERARADAEQQQLVAEGAVLVKLRAAQPVGESLGDWDDGALCRQTDPETWFPEKGGSSAQAVAVCHNCPARIECLAQALDRREAYGVWGGKTESARRAMLRQGVTGNAVRAWADVV